MASWEFFRYGRKQHQQGELWRPSKGLRRGCLVYVQGGGWSMATSDRVRDSHVGLPLFQSGIEPLETVPGEGMVVVSALLASASYDTPLTRGNDHSPPAWQVDTAYNVGGESVPVYVLEKGTVFRCFRNHVSAQDNRPASGAAWAEHWEIPAPNDIGASHALALPAAPGFSRAACRPGFLEAGVLDLLLLVKFLKQNATALGIDPRKIVLHGDSAAGQACGAAAYSLGSPFVPSMNRIDPVARHLAGARRDAAMHDSRVSGVILEITPDDWRHYPSGPLHVANLFGLDGSGQAQQYSRLRDEQKAALSPLGMLRATGRHLPTFLHYPLDDPGDDPGDDSPPWKSTKYHHADNGEQIRLELERLGQTNIAFYHKSNLPPDIGSTMHAWLRQLWRYPLQT